MAIRSWWKVCGNVYSIFFSGGVGLTPYKYRCLLWIKLAYSSYVFSAYQSGAYWLSAYWLSAY